MGGALEHEAELLLESLDEEQRKAARRLLVELVAVRGEAGLDTRQRRFVAELRPAEQAKGRIFDDVLERLVNARLLVRGEEQGAASVEVAHESLIRRWKTLRGWVDADREKLGALAKLRSWTAEWRQFPGALLRDDQIGYAREMVRTYAEDLDEGSRQLIAFSEAEVETQARTQRRAPADGTRGTRDSPRAADSRETRLVGPEP